MVQQAQQTWNLNRIELIRRLAGTKTTEAYSQNQTEQMGTQSEDPKKEDDILLLKKPLSDIDKLHSNFLHPRKHMFLHLKGRKEQETRSLLNRICKTE